MIKTYKVRLLPNKDQEELLYKHANCSRFIWNWGLAYIQNIYNDGGKYLTGYSLNKIVVQLKQQEDYKWLTEVSSQTLKNTILDLDKAFKSFFKKSKGHPKFKKKNKSIITFSTNGTNLYFKDNFVNIEKIGKIEYQTNFNLPEGRHIYKFSNARIKFINKKWILTFGMEFENQEHKLNNYSMGIDLGIKNLAIISYEDKNIIFKNINKTKKVKNLKNKLKYLQRKVSKKYNYNNKNNIYVNKWYKSKNILRYEDEIKKIYTKLSNIRYDYIHKCTSRLIKLYPKTVIMEDLKIQDMMKNKNLSKAIQEQCLYEFIRQMKYKCEWNGIEFIQVDRWFPSSKTCSNCGEINHNLKLSDRVYRCEYCGFEIDRDINASMNLMNYSNV